MYDEEVVGTEQTDGNKKLEEKVSNVIKQSEKFVCVICMLGALKKFLKPLKNARENSLN